MRKPSLSVLAVLRSAGDPVKRNADKMSMASGFQLRSLPFEMVT